MRHITICRSSSTPHGSGIPNIFRLWRAPLWPWRRGRSDHRSASRRSALGRSAVASAGTIRPHDAGVAASRHRLDAPSKETDPLKRITQVTLSGFWDFPPVRLSLERQDAQPLDYRIVNADFQFGRSLGCFQHLRVHDCRKRPFAPLVADIISLFLSHLFSIPHHLPDNTTVILVR